MHDVVYDLGVGSIGCIRVIAGSISFGSHVACYDLSAMLLRFLPFHYSFLVLSLLGGWSGTDGKNGPGLPIDEAMSFGTVPSWRYCMAWRFMTT